MWLVYSGIFVGTILTGLMTLGGVTKKKQSKYFDKYNSLIFKGIAILCVMMCHFMGDFGEGITIFTPLGGIGVSIFLMLSAYGLNESWIYNGKIYWWRKRIMNVVIPYMLMNSAFFWGGAKEKISIINYFTDIFLLRPQHPYGGYLNYLLLWYVIFYVVMRLNIDKKKKLITFGLISIILFVVCGEIRAEQSLSFLTGILLSEFKESNEIKKYMNWKWGSALIVFGCVFLALKQTEVIRMGSLIVFKFIQMLIKLPCRLGLCLVVMSISSKINLRFLALVGTISYELYLVQGYILSQVPLSIKGELVFLGLSIVLAVFLWLIVDKTKIVQRKL